MENNLIQRLENGDENAYYEIFHDYFPVLVAFAFKYLNDIDLSKEIAQNVFVKIYEKRQILRISSNLKSYLFRMVYNDCMNLIKREKTIRLHHQEYIQKQEIYENIDDVSEQTEREYRIYQAINKLPPQCKLIIQRSRFEGKKNQSIAEELGISVRTVETQISKALRLLKSIVKIFF